MLHAGTICPVEIRRLDLSSPDADLLPAMSILAAADGERAGGLDPMPADLALARLRSPGPTGERHVLLAGEASDPSGVAVVDIETGPVNTHIGQLTLAVPPGRRRRGVGRALTERAAEDIASSGRTLLITSTDSFVPAGAAFADALGFEAGLVMRVNRLDVAAVDWSLVDAWIAEADPAYELVAVDGVLADDLVPAFIAAVDAMNDAPTDDLDVEDEETTIEHIRAREARDAETKARALLLLARDRATGDGAGFTGVRWHPHNPAVLWQGGTATNRDHRGHGLGRWMKAAMLRWVAEELPSVTEVRTENAHTNPHMLAINDALGFVPYAEETIHQRRLG
jgi:mycothiol synthase